MSVPRHLAEYLPALRPAPVVSPGEFVFAAAFLEHAHIYGQCSGLIEAGAQLKWVYDPDATKVEAFRAKHPGVRVARAYDEILNDPDVRLVAAAAVPCDRARIGFQAMDAGKDYFTDKAPFTSLAQLDLARAAVGETGRKYLVYYSERLHVESAMFATDFLAAGEIGRVLQVLGLGPHRLSKSARPDWFWDKAKSGGILCDIGSHQFEQFLTFSGAADASVTHAAVANYANPDLPDFEDFGEASLLGDNGSTQYVRVDWLTPDGLGTWGDGRTVILGTSGYVELRKYVDIARDPGGDHVYVVDARGEHRINVAGQVGFRFFGQLILDCLHRTEHAMTQTHAFKAAELSLRAQLAARKIT